MYISTSKTYSNISLTEVKEALRIAIDDPTYDSEILYLIEASLTAVENYIGENVAYTSSVLEDYNIRGKYYSIQEPKINITGITTYDTEGNPTIISGFTTYKYFNSTLIKFPRSINAHRLVITYTSGYQTEIPALLKRAMIIKVRELFDNGDQYVSNNMMSTHAFERLLTPYINI